MAKANQAEWTPAQFITSTAHSYSNRIQQIETNCSNPQCNGVRHHYKQLEKYIPAFRFGTLTIIGARPSMGKTTFMSNLVRQMITPRDEKYLQSMPNYAPDQNKNTVFLFVNLEMPEDYLWAQLESQITGIPLINICDYRLDKQQIQKIKEKVSDVFIQNMRCAGFQIHTPDTTRVDVKDIRALVESVINYTDKKVCLMIDYINQLSYDKTNVTMTEYQDRTLVAKELQNISRSYDNRVCVICASQLSRNKDKRGEPPTEQDLKGSGALEDCADTVILLHREEYYIERDTKLQTTKPDEYQQLLNENKNKLEILINKNKYGRPGKVILHVDFKFAKISSFIDDKCTITYDDIETEFKRLELQRRNQNRKAINKNTVQDGAPAQEATDVPDVPVADCSLYSSTKIIDARAVNLANAKYTEIKEANEQYTAMEDGLIDKAPAFETRQKELEDDLKSLDDDTVLPWSPDKDDTVLQWLLDEAYKQDTDRREAVITPTKDGLIPPHDDIPWYE